MCVEDLSPHCLQATRGALLAAVSVADAPVLRIGPIVLWPSRCYGEVILGHETPRSELMGEVLSAVLENAGYRIVRRGTAEVPRVPQAKLRATA